MNGGRRGHSICFVPYNGGVERNKSFPLPACPGRFVSLALKRIGTKGTNRLHLGLERAAQLGNLPATPVPAQDPETPGVYAQFPASSALIGSPITPRPSRSQWHQGLRHRDRPSPVGIAPRSHGGPTGAATGRAGYKRPPRAMSRPRAARMVAV